ncbi:MAG: hypothetical protein ACOCZR_04655 [Halanaerobiales bacterium]
MGDYNRRRPRRKRKCQGNTCTNTFCQDIECEFDVTFAVDIEDVELTDITCGRGV